MFNRSLIWITAFLLLCPAPGIAQGVYTETLNYDYIQELDRGVRFYHRGDYDHARKIFKKILTKSNGKYYSNQVVFQWLLASMIQDRVPANEIFLFCLDIIKNTPQGGPTVKFAREFLEKHHPAQFQE